MAGAHAELVDAGPAWDAFLSVPDDLRVDYADGKAFVHTPSYAHQKTCLRLRDLLAGQLGDRAIVAVGVGWLLPGAAGATVRVPDLMVLLEEPVTDVVTSAPPIVVEVLSPSSRGDDLVLKSPEYLAAGVEQYWILDPRDRVLDVFARGPGGWERVGQLSDAAPEAVIAVPELGTVTVPLPPLLN